LKKYLFSHQDDKKKDDKSPAEAMDTSESSPQKLLLCLTLQVEILTFFGKRYISYQPFVYADLGVEKIFRALNACLLIPDVWKLLQVPSPNADIPLLQQLQLSCGLVSTIAVNDIAMRIHLCNLGAVRLMATILLQSREIVGAEQLETLEGQENLSFLYRASEQAILLLCSKEIGPNQQQEHVGTALSFFSDRPMVSYAYETDNDLFTSQTVSLSTITDLLSSADPGVTARVARIISVLISSSADPLHLLSNAPISAASVTYLSKLVHLHALRLIDSADTLLTAVVSVAAPSVSIEIETRLSAVCDDLSVLGLDDVIKSTTNFSVTKLSASSALSAISYSLNETLNLNSEEVMCWLLRIFEIILRDSPENIKLFASKDNASVFSKLLYCMGPIADADLGCTARQEKIFSVFDPRQYSIYRGTESGCVQTIIFRSFVLDVLSIVIDSDPKYRNYGNGSIPTEAGVALSDSTLLTAESVDFVGKACVDPCVAILLGISSLGVTTSKTLKVTPTYLPLNLSVLKSSLMFLRSISSCGIFGIVNASSSIAFAEAPVGESDFKNALKTFKLRLGNAFTNLIESLSSNEELELFKSSPTSIAPLHFDNAFTDACSIVLSQEVLPTISRLWPLITLSSSILGVLSNPSLGVETQEIALSCVAGFSKAIQFGETNQPAVVDVRFYSIRLKLKNV